MPKHFLPHWVALGLTATISVAACGPSPSTESTIEPTTLSPTTLTTAPATAPPTDAGNRVSVGAARLVANDFATVRGLRVGVITNEAALVDDRPLVDLLATTDQVELVAVFAPEHGVGADGAAGETVDGGLDLEREVMVHSLYGSERAPTPESLSEVDVLLFDLQDVGVRAYTYLATMGLAMVAAAEADVPFVVLDRPNPLGGEHIAGFVREPAFDSFISQYPVPAVHGLTAGELALAIKGEGWLPGLESLQLDVVPIEGWSRARRWSETGLRWQAPSPSLPTTEAATVYPGTVLLEATSVSVGRGTSEPFTVVGAPWIDGEAVAATLNGRQLPGVRFEPVTFVPEASPLAPSPRYAGQEVPGVRVVVEDEHLIQAVEVGVHLLDVLWAHADANGVEDFLVEAELLDLLAGTDQLRHALVRRTAATAIVQSWQDDVRSFATLRQPYLLYD